MDNIGRFILNICIFIGFFILQQLPLMILQGSILLKLSSNLANVVIISVIFMLVSFAVIWLMWHYYQSIKTADTESNQRLNSNPRTIKIIVVAALVNIAINLITVPFMHKTNENADALSTLMMAFIVAMVIYAMVMGPILEELLFRGLFMNMFFQKYRWLTLVLSSIFFGLAHGGDLSKLASIDWIYLGSKILIGFVLGLVYQRTKNLKASMAVHIINNLSSIFLPV